MPQSTILLVPTAANRSLLLAVMLSCVCLSVRVPFTTVSYYNSTKSYI